MIRIAGPSTDVLIVGAGPVGLTLALGLATLKVGVRIIDKNDGPKDEPRAAVIWPRGTEALDDFGAGERVRAAANELKRLDLYSRGRRMGAVPLGALDSRFPHPLMIEQHLTERLLIARLAELGVSVERSVEAGEPRLDATRVLTPLTHSDGRTETAESAWIVGCDGSNSVVRKGLGLPFEGRRKRNLQLVQVNAKPRWRHRDEPERGFFFIAPEACLGCFPQPGGAYRFFAYITDPDPSLTAPPTLQEARDLIAAVAGAPELELTEPTWFNRARFQKRFAGRFRQGRGFVAGDAAHVWPSIGGHGMNIGLRGAHNLAWKLAAVHRGEAPDALLDTFDAEERRTAEDFLRLMKLNLVEYPTTRFGFLPREAMLRAGMALPGVARLLERAVSDLDAGHRGSPLSRDAARVRGLRAGDRLPDHPVETAGGPTTLHRLLAYDRWTLFVPQGLAPDLLSRVQRVVGEAAPSAAVVAVGGMPGLSSALVLVRPDRHVGLLARPDDAASLDAYVTAWLRPPRTSAAASRHSTLEPAE